MGAPITTGLAYQMSKRPLDSITNCLAIEQNNKLRALFQNDLVVTPSFVLRWLSVLQTENRTNEFDLASRDTEALLQSIRADRIYSIKGVLALKKTFEISNLINGELHSQLSTKMQTNIRDINTVHARYFSHLSFMFNNHNWILIDVFSKAKVVRDVKGNSLVMNDLIFPFNVKGMQNIGNQKGFDSYFDFNVKLS